MGGEEVEAVAEEIENRRHVAAAQAVGGDEEIDALGELRGARVGGDDVVERVVRVFSAWLGAVGIGAVVEEPADGGGLHGFAWGEEDGEVAGPFGVDVGAVANEQV